MAHGFAEACGEPLAGLRREAKMEVAFGEERKPGDVGLYDGVIDRIVQS